MPSQLVWCQDKSYVYVTIELEPNENSKITLVDNNILRVESKEQNFDVELFDCVKNINVYSRRFYELELEKETNDKSFWPRLLKEQGKKSWITINWSRWVDEDAVIGSNDINVDKISDTSSDSKIKKKFEYKKNDNMKEFDDISSDTSDGIINDINDKLETGDDDKLSDSCSDQEKNVNDKKSEIQEINENDDDKL